MVFSYCIHVNKLCRILRVGFSTPRMQLKSLSSNIEALQVGSFLHETIGLTFNGQLRIWEKIHGLCGRIFG